MTAQLLPSQQKIASSDIEVAHRDVLIRLRSIIGSRAGEGSLRLRYRQRRSTTRAGISDVQVVLACPSSRSPGPARVRPSQPLPPTPEARRQRHLASTLWV